MTVVNKLSPNGT